MSQTINLPVTGKLTIKQYNESGVLIDERKVNNMVVTVGKNWIAQRVYGNNTIGGATGMMNYMSVGYGTTAAALGDTTLANEAARVGATGSSSSNTVVYQATFPAGVGSTGVTEAGIFNASSSGTMLARTVFSVINKGASDTLAITWTITIG